MDGILSSASVTMVNTRGSLRSVASGMVNSLKLQGWKIVINPKRDYYPELDMAGKNHQNNPVSEIDDEIESKNILVFEDV